MENGKWKMESIRRAPHALCSHLPFAICHFPSAPRRPARRVDDRQEVEHPGDGRVKRADLREPRLGLDVLVRRALGQFGRNVRRAEPTGPASACPMNHGRCRTFCAKFPCPFISGACTTRIPATRIPKRNTARIVAPTVTARTRSPISQYPAPGTTHPASATSGGGGALFSAESVDIERDTVAGPRDRASNAYGPPPAFVSVTTRRQ